MSNQWIELRLPAPSDVGKFMLWVGGRCLLSGTLVLIQGWKFASRASTVLSEMTERSIHQWLRVWDAMPLMGMPYSLTVEAEAVPITDINPIKDIASLLVGKHVLIIGDTGTGKSTLAQYMAYLIPGKVCVYDADAAPDEWSGLEVIGRGGDYDSIRVAMETDLIDLQNRIKLRGEQGDSALAGIDTTTICEEFPDIAAEIDIGSEWMVRHGRRGRKPRRFLILLSQDDSVKALDIEGEGSVRKNFRYFRLGKFAIEHAKRLKNPQLVEWLKQRDRPCMADDEPVLVPSLAEMRAVIPRPLPQRFTDPPVTAELPSQIGLEAPESDQEPVTDIGDEALWKAIKALLDEGKAESWIIKSVLGYEGRYYQAGKGVLEAMKQRFS